MKKYCMDIKSINIQRVVYLIILLVIIASVKYILYIINIPYFDTIKEKIFSVLLITAVLSYIFTVNIWLPLRYKRTAYYVNDDVIYIQKGIFIMSCKYINLSHIRFVIKISVPVLSSRGCSFLVAGGCGVRLALTFISQNDCREISEYLEYRINEIKESKGETLL